MTTTHLPHPRHPHRHAFTLVELIIVIVVLAVLSTIAIAGYRAVVDHTQDAKAEQTVANTVREAYALAAFRSDGTFTDADMAAAIADLGPQGVSPGVLADSGSNGWALTKAGPVSCSDPTTATTLPNGLRPYAAACYQLTAQADLHTVSYAIADDHQHLAAAVKSETGAVMFARIDTHGTLESGGGQGSGQDGDDTAIPGLYDTWYQPGAWTPPTSSSTTTVPATTTTTDPSACSAPSPVGTLYSAGDTSNQAGSWAGQGMVVDSPVMDFGSCRWVVITGVRSWGPNSSVGDGSLVLEAVAYGSGWDGTISLTYLESGGGNPNPAAGVSADWSGTAAPIPAGGGAFTFVVQNGTWQTDPYSAWGVLVATSDIAEVDATAGTVTWMYTEPDTTTTTAPPATTTTTTAPTTTTTAAPTTTTTAAPTTTTTAAPPANYTPTAAITWNTAAATVSANLTFGSAPGGVTQTATWSSYLGTNWSQFGSLNLGEFGPITYTGTNPTFSPRTTCSGTCVLGSYGAGAQSIFQTYVKVTNSTGGCQVYSVTANLSPFLTSHSATVSTDTTAVTTWANVVAPSCP